MRVAPVLFAVLLAVPALGCEEKKKSETFSELPGTVMQLDGEKVNYLLPPAPKEYDGRSGNKNPQL